MERASQRICRNQRSLSRVTRSRSARGEDENSLSALLREEALTRKPTELRVSDSLGKQLLSTKSTYPSWRFSIGCEPRMACVSDAAVSPVPQQGNTITHTVFS